MDHGADDVRPHDLTARLLGLDDFRVLTVVQVGGELEVLIETMEAVTGCQRCEVLAARPGVGSTWSATSSARGVRCCWCGSNGCGAAVSRPVRRGRGRRPAGAYGRPSAANRGLGACWLVSVLVTGLQGGLRAEFTYRHNGGRVTGGRRW